MSRWLDNIFIRACVCICVFAGVSAGVFALPQISQAAAPKGILSFGMSKNDESFFYQEIPLADRFGATDMGDEQQNLELLTATSVGNTFDGKSIDIRSSINSTQTASASSQNNIGQDLRNNDEVSKQAPSALYNPEQADGFVYGTQEEADNAASAQQSAPLSAGTLDGGSSSAPLTGWKRVFVSWYGPGFIGNHMANGEVLTSTSMIVAHKTLPFGTKVEINYNGKTALAVVKDRGPFIPGREFDLGPGIAKALGFSGVHFVNYRIVK